MAVIDNLSATINGDDATISGTVDGVPISIHVWLSHLNTLPTKAAKRQFVAAQLKAAAPQAAQNIDLSGTAITL